MHTDVLRQLARKVRDGRLLSPISNTFWCFGRLVYLNDCRPLVGTCSQWW